MKTSNILSAKNYQSVEVVKKMYEKSFNNYSDGIEITKLSGGLKNAVYLINDGGSKVVLKVAPNDESKMISADKNIMWWEAEMLKKMSSLEIPTPKLLYFDDTHEICPAPYIFMSYIDGNNFLECKDKLTIEEVANIEYQLGDYSSKICSIKGKSFFLPSQPTKNFKNNYEFVMNLFDLLLNDAFSKKMSFGKNSYEGIRDVIQSKQDSLNNITNLCLSHTDIWDGNVKGIIDFSDLYYCDELMTFYFHTIDGKTSSNFLRGFNNKQLNYDEKTRIEIYRMYVLLKMMVDCELKQYGKFDWMYEKFDEQFQKVKKR